MFENKIFFLKKRKLIKTFLHRIRYKTIEYEYILLKLLIKNKIISKQTRALAVFYLAFLCETTSKTKNKNVCLNSGYKRSIIINFGLNRNFVREEIGKNLFPGYSPAKR
jgi:ribosomal protein S14